jgi:hypothetical protein
MAHITNRLTEEEVRARLKVCTETAVIDEIYTFGQMLLKETVASFRLLDTKAASIAAYGAAIVTLLVSSSSTWLPLGGHGAAVVGFLAGLAAFLAAFFSVRALALMNVEWLSEREWLEESCLNATDKLKRYRILTIWGAMSSRKDAHLEKVRRLKNAQFFLIAAVFLLLIVLFQIVWNLGLSQSLGLAGWKIV